MKVNDRDRIREAIERAARKRLSVDRPPLDAWRVVNGRGDDAPPGLTIDWYRRVLVLAARSELGETIPRAWAQVAMEVLEAEGLVLKTLARLPRGSRSEVFAGDVPQAPLRIREDEAVFLCELNRGISTGLFLDHRETRRWVRAHTDGREVLNLFAYTCAFSVQAALGGAKRVTSVDVSKRSLARGRENMTASGLDPDRHRWFADDVLEHLARQRRRGPAFDLVVADPPVLGHAGRSTFSLERDLDTLATGCVGSTKPGGTVVISAHATALAAEEMCGRIEGAAARMGRSTRVLLRLGLPEWDHPTIAAEQGHSGEADRGDYLKTLVFETG
jgi:23S rRNA (cytosine1962-C5)-methyltransferase